VFDPACVSDRRPAPLATAAGRPLRVVHVDAERGFSGGEVQVFLLLAGLAARGHRQALVCPPGSRAAAELRARRLPVECLEVALGNDLDLGAAARLCRAVAPFRPDLLHLHTGRATWHGARAARRLGVPALTTRRMDRRVRRSLRNRWLYGRLLQLAVGISPRVSALLAEGGVPAHKIRTVWSVVDPARVAGARPREEVRRELGCGAEERLVLAAAALVRRKGLDLLLEALAGAAGERPLRAVIAGEGRERRRLERRAAAPDLAGRVRFVGRVEALADLLAAADVVAVPSRAEGLGIAALEAMAAGRPVVAARVGGLAEAVVDGESGLLFPAEDVPALRAALLRLAADDGLCAQLGAGGRARIAQQFLPEHMVAAYEGLYGELLGVPA
jgi:glycosyltransferase involved in cell wall biosynthesis